MYVCDPEAGEECTGDPIEDTSYYKLINRNAKHIPLCDPSDENCEALICPLDEVDCTVTLCDPVTAEENGVECSDPVAYSLENPIEEEEVLDEEGGAVDVPESDVPAGETVQDGTSVENMGDGGSVVPKN